MKNNQTPFPLQIESFLDIAGVIFVALDNSGTIRMINNKGCEILGYEPEEITGKDWFEQCVPRELAATVKNVFNQMIKGKFEPLEFFRNPVITKTGTERIIQWHNTVLHDGHGDIYGTLSSGEDITEQIRMEEALKQSEEKYRLLVENQTDLIVKVDNTGIFQFVSPSYCRLFGKTEEELVGSSFMPLVHAEDRERTARAMDQLLHKPHIVYIEQRAMTIKGWRWLGWIDTALIDSTGQVYSVIGAGRDITDRKQAELNLEESRRQLSTLMGNLPGMAYRCNNDRHWTMEFISSGCSKLTGYTPEELLGNSRVSYAQLIHSDDRQMVWDSIQGAVEQGCQFQLAYRINTAGGNMKWVWEQGLGVHVPGSSRVVLEGFIADITAQKTAENELHTYQQRLESLVEKRTAELASANKDLEAFAYSVSHDLRAPLRAVNGFTRILMEEYVDKLDSEAKRLGTIIEENTDKMARLIDDLLTLSRTGRAAVKISDVDMHHMAEAIFHEVTTEQERNTISLNIGPMPPAPADTNLMRQVWTNLISNAVKFTSRTKNPEISIHGTCRGKNLVYSVQDNGAGFNMKYADKLFGVFQRLHNEKDFKGTGVGLALVQRIITKHHGRVWAEAEEGKGAIFFFSLPAAKNISSNKKTDLLKKP